MRPNLKQFLSSKVSNIQFNYSYLFATNPNSTTTLFLNLSTLTKTTIHYPATTNSPNYHLVVTKPLSYWLTIHSNYFKLLTSSQQAKLLH